jgi:WD repeat-containing protein 61
MSAAVPKTGHKLEGAHADNVWSLYFGGGHLLSGSLDGTVKLWTPSDDGSGLKCTAQSSKQKVGVTSIVALQDFSTAVVSYQDAKIRFFSIPSLVETETLDPGLLEAWTVCVSPDDGVLVSGTHKGSVNIWSMQPGHEKIATLETHNKFILSAAFNADGKLATAGIDGFVNVFDMSTQQVVHKVEPHALAARSIVFSPDGHLIYTASDDRHVSIYDTLSGTIINSFSQSGMAYSVDASQDYRHFVVGCADSTVAYWDLGMQRCLHRFDSHSDQVWGVQFDKADRTGKRFASVGDDALIQIYE